MSETAATTEAEKTAVVTEPSKPETDWKAEARKWEGRAKENSNAADRLKELEDAQKSEIEKATARAEAAEKALTAATLDRDRMSVALAKGLDPDLAPLLSGESKDDIEKQAELLASRLTTSKPKPRVGDLKSGATGGDSGGLTGKERAAQALRQMRGQGNQ